MILVLLKFAAISRFFRGGVMGIDIAASVGEAKGYVVAAGVLIILVCVAIQVHAWMRRLMREIWSTN